SLADDGADVLELGEHLLVGQSSAPARDRLELVERAARVAEAAPGELGHRDTEHRDERRERERDLVADSPGRVLVRRRAGERGEVHAFAARDHRGGPARDLGAVHAVEQDRHIEGAHLLLGHDAARVRVDDPVDLGVAQAEPVALGDDDVDRVEGLGHGCARSTRSLGPNASGSTSAIVLNPLTVSSTRSGPPCSKSSWRQRPHGMRTLPWPSTHVNATSRPPPLAWSAETSPHSAHSPTPYEAFSTLQPTTTRPSSTSAATPTGNFEYGTYARCMTSRAAARRASQSTC